MQRGQHPGRAAAEQGPLAARPAARGVAVEVSVRSQRQGAAGTVANRGDHHTLKIIDGAHHAGGRYLHDGPVVARPSLVQGEIKGPVRRLNRADFVQPEIPRTMRCTDKSPQRLRHHTRDLRRRPGETP